MNEFYSLLDRYNTCQNPAEAAEIEAQLWARWGVQRTVLVQDMSGFSRLVRRWGIVHYLTMVRQMQILTRPLVQAMGGEVVKYEADNLYASFLDPESAVLAARAINAAFRTYNLTQPVDKDIHVSIGIASGRILLLPGQDFFGDAVNIACKLGEDLAERGQVLIEDDSFSLLGKETQAGFESAQWEISGLSLSGWHWTTRVPGA